ncbi:hypothetical protein PV762_21965 [Mitsuaria sp. CC2]|uniref:hypothetical protein n=1 Tax=Mitsuaria sp. CC2 TaxID=3029186 RepID=UPI003B8CB34D
MTVLRRGALALALILPVLLLSGCDVRQRLDSAEDRINAAIPVGIDIRQARERFAEQLGPKSADLAAFNQAWTARLRARALSCSPDFMPSWRHSNEQVKAGVGNRNCFAEFDRTLSRWVGVQRVRFKLQQAPVAVGGIPPSITLRGDLSSLSRDAGRAPVVAVTSSEGIELVALDGSRSPFKEAGARSEVSVSPNGQLFAQAVGGMMRIRATDGGDTLLEIADARSVHWLSADYLGVRSASNKPASLISLRSAEQAPIVNSGQSSSEMLLPVPAHPDRFNVLTFLGLYQYGVSERDGSLTLTLATEKPGVDARLMSMTSGAGQFSADGNEWVLAGSHKLVRLDLNTLAVSETSFEPVLVQNAAPTANRDQFVLNLTMPGGVGGVISRNGNYLFDAANGTLARVEGAAAQRHVRYFPAIQRLSHIMHPTMWLSEQLETSPPVPAREVVAAMLDEVNQRKLALAAAEEQRIDQSPALQAGSPLLPAVREAQVEGIGIYEAREKIAQPGQSRSIGRVDVVVRRSARPVVLVLCSYEAVQWNLKLESGARLGAVLVGGYYDSTVKGAGDARVLKIGRVYAYKQEGPEFSALQREVARWAGRPISLFQSGYDGASYSVGGP